MPLQYIDLDEEMDMTTPCIHCNTWFDLLDGYRSKKWHINTVICDECHLQEQKEIERDEEIEELKQTIQDAEFDILECSRRLRQLGVSI